MAVTLTNPTNLTDLQVDSDCVVKGNFEVQGNFDFGDTSTDNLTINGDLIVGDDQKLHFGADEDASIEYDEDGTDLVQVTGVNWVFNSAVKVTGTLTGNLASSITGLYAFGASGTDHTFLDASSRFGLYASGGTNYWGVRNGAGSKLAVALSAAGA